jgi:hypothetical protein
LNCLKTTTDGENSEETEVTVTAARHSLNARAATHPTARHPHITSGVRGESASDVSGRVVAFPDLNSAPRGLCANLRRSTQGARHRLDRSATGPSSFDALGTDTRGPGVRRPRRS